MEKFTAVNNRPSCSWQHLKTLQNPHFLDFSITINTLKTLVSLTLEPAGAVRGHTKSSPGAVAKFQLRTGGAHSCHGLSKGYFQIRWFLRFFTVQKSQLVVYLPNLWSLTHLGWLKIEMKCFVTFCYILSFIWVAFPAFQRIQPPSIGDDSNWPANFARGVGTCWNYQLATVVTFLPNDELWSLWKTVEFCGWCRWWHPLGRPQRWVHLFPVDRGRRKRKARGADLAKTQSHRYPLFYQEPPRFRWPQRYDNEYGDTPNTFRFFFGHPASCKRCSDVHFRSTQWDPYDTANKDEGYFWLRLRFWRASHNTKGWTLSAPLQLRDKVPFSWCVCSKFRKRQRFASQNAVRLPVSDCLSCMAGVKENKGKIIWRFPKMGVPLSHVF